MWLNNGSMALRDGKEVQKIFGGIQRTLYLWWKRNVAYPGGKLDDDVRHVLSRRRII